MATVYRAHQGTLDREVAVKVLSDRFAKDPAFVERFRRVNKGTLQVDTTYTDPAQPPPAPTRPGEYPVARKTANPNEVISPYEPYNIIDVEGFRPGQLARDPSNNKIFRVP